MKKDRRVKILLLILSIIICVSCNGAVSHPDSFIGRWRGRLEINHYEIRQFEFFSDGTLLGGYYYHSQYVSKTWQWRIVNNRLIITDSDRGEAFNYKFTGNTLVLTYNNEDEVTLTKQE